MLPSESVFSRIQSSKVTAALTRARLAIQHAHQYYSLALHVADELKPATRGSRIVEGFAGDLANMSRQNEYRGMDSLGFILVYSMGSDIILVQSKARSYRRTKLKCALTKSSV